MSYTYTPTPLMAPDCHYDKKIADRAVKVINSFCHTKGIWQGKPFILLPWQETIIRDIFGIVKEDGSRQFKTAYVEIPKKNGKSELAAAIAIYLFFFDHEAAAEVYGCAADRQQASIVFNVAAEMVRQWDELASHIKILDSSKRMVCKETGSVYQVLSAEVGTKHGLNVSGVVFDELHTQPTRELYDVMTMGSGDARRQPLYFFITTAGNNRNSICYEVHQKAKDILEGRKSDPTFYPCIYGIDENDDWTDEKVWYKANPSLGTTIDVQKVRDACNSAKENPAEENAFRQLRLNQWVGQALRWMPMHKWDECKKDYTETDLLGRVCYGGLDLSVTTDVTAFVLVFPPMGDEQDFKILPYFWLPKDNIMTRVRRDHVMYDVWAQKGLFNLTSGVVIDYSYVEATILELGKKFRIKGINFDRYGAAQMVQNLNRDGFDVHPFAQTLVGYNAPTKELMRLVLEKKISHNGHPVLRWMMDNIFIKQDAQGNIMPDKAKSAEKIDGVVATIMALDLAQRNMNKKESVYNTRGLLVL